MIAFISHRPRLCLQRYPFTDLDSLRQLAKTILLLPYYLSKIWKGGVRRIREGGKQCRPNRHLYEYSKLLCLRRSSTAYTDLVELLLGTFHAYNRDFEG